MEKRYIVGIDLGTTNSAVSYVDLQAETPSERTIRIFQVPQLVGAGEFARRNVLPSFLYIPGPYDIAKEAVTIPWKTEDDNFVGAFARDHGAFVPARLVSSAKSWLCHARADRRAKILPWGAGDDLFKVSPVAATAYYLRHIRRAWNQTVGPGGSAEVKTFGGSAEVKTFAGDDTERHLENQHVTITVPASFDEVARDLTLEAAVMAGLPNVTLLEEPLAAFYSWLSRVMAQGTETWRDHVRPGELILVCDVGGGTTDFTLITLREVEGSPRFERIAVGDHLILGGDNIDLALARRVEAKMAGKKNRTSGGDRWQSLCHLCRGAKESILQGETDIRHISLAGRGKNLIAGTLSAELTRAEVEETVLDGFFPMVDASAESVADGRKGITEFGLPYESEPAITRHIGWFLEKHRDDVRHFLGRDDLIPDLILFNGGSLKAPIVQERIRSAIRHWFNVADGERPRLLDNPEPDLAVALGATYYGLVKIGRGVRVGSGSPRSYYIGVSRFEGVRKLKISQGVRKLKLSQDVSTEGPGDAENGRQAICIVERGLDEGSRAVLKDREFEVLANQPVAFDLYSSSFRSGDRRGDVLTVDETFTPLPPLQTVIQFGRKAGQVSVPVRIEVEYTETGTLALWCQSTTTDHRWRLQFQLRDLPETTGVAERDIFDEALVERVCAHVADAFTGGSGGQPRSGSAEVKTFAMLTRLPRDIAEIVERPKEAWPLSLIRDIADVLLDHADAREVSAQAESRWLNLTGFCLRPGFGDGADELRLKKLWKLYKPGPVHENQAQVRPEWWILWRRVAGGLHPGQQRQFFQDLSATLFHKKKGGKSKVSPQEQREIWMAAANMELLQAKEKARLGDQLLSEINPKKAPPQYLWALSRIGARELFYGPVDRVVPAEHAARWVAGIIKKQWPDPKPAAHAVIQMARRTGDRIRDLDPDLLEAVRVWLGEVGCAEIGKPLTEVVPLETRDARTIFGESLPSGLVLKN